MASSGKCRVFLISGFLGSGKTTMLLHLLETRPEDETLGVLMNEFGRIGVDGEISYREGLEILEINQGSIFCACAKGDFMRGLYSIAREWKPSILLIEASGIADTSDIERDLSIGPLGRFYALADSICVVDAEHFSEWADHFNAVSRQTHTATVIIINKRDLVNKRKMQKLRLEITGLNDTARIYETSFGRIPWDLLKSGSSAGVRENPGEVPAEEDIESYIDSALQDPEAHLAPPDALLAQCICWEGTPEDFRSLMGQLPADVVRAKGFFKDESGDWIRFDLVKGSQVQYIPFGQRRRSGGNLGVFIREKREPKEIPILFSKSRLHVLDVKI
ncbi:MAG: CobW family GTP-binding protein [Thermovirgaceae bacterium]